MVNHFLNFLAAMCAGIIIYFITCHFLPNMTIEEFNNWIKYISIVMAILLLIAFFFKKVPIFLFWLSVLSFNTLVFSIINSSELELANATAKMQKLIDDYAKEKENNNKISIFSYKKEENIPNYTDVKEYKHNEEVNKSEENQISKMIWKILITSITSTVIAFFISLEAKLAREEDNINVNKSTVVNINM